MADMRGVTASLLLLLGCTAMQAPEPVQFHRLQRVDSIRFEINSWGRPMEAFVIRSDGSGEYRHAPSFGADQEIHAFNAGPMGFGRIRAALAGIERYISRAPACGQRMTDFPYGEIAWLDGIYPTTLRFDVGCQGAEMQRVVEAAHQAARLAEQFSRPGAGH